MTAILGDPDRLKALAADFVDHYEARIEEGATVVGKAMFVSSSRAIAYAFYKELGIDFEEKAFYDILKALTIKYDIQYPEDKLLDLAKKVKIIVDDKAKYNDETRRLHDPAPPAASHTKPP
jgi:type I site-specific restriction-modification system R (restriction) subunit